MMAKRLKNDAIQARPPLFDHLQRRCIFARRELTIYAARLGLAEKKPDFSKKNPPGQLRLVIDVPGAAGHPEFVELLSALNPAFEVLDVVGSPDYHPRFQLTANDEWCITSALGEFDDLRQLNALIAIDNKRADELASVERELERHTKGLTPEGRKKGGESTQQRKADHKKSIKFLVEEKLNGAAGFSFTDEKLVSDLVMDGRLTHGTHTIRERTLRGYVAEIRKDLESAVKAKNA